MPSSDLASAITDAVREHVPPASLSSVAAHEPSGTAVRYLVNPSASTSILGSVPGHAHPHTDVGR
ncbi:hypothetical protein C8Q80DRAFT_1200760 [Daedaleopsis nitida]|nr:hypothetical protein C8Q80DRAFT_1200760 [Daedaleopsis nitida]